MKTIRGLPINLISSAHCSQEWHLILKLRENFLPQEHAGAPKATTEMQPIKDERPLLLLPPSSSHAGQGDRQTRRLIGFCVLRTGGKLSSAQVALEKAGKRDALWATSSPFWSRAASLPPSGFPSVIFFVESAAIFYPHCLLVSLFLYYNSFLINNSISFLDFCKVF